MKRTYRIVTGAFLDGEGKVRTAGESIELDSDVASVHASHLELLPTKPVSLPDEGPTTFPGEAGTRPDVDRFR